MEFRDLDMCRFDEVSLGEVMLRLDPGDRRIRNARSFDVWEGGGEYNVARGLRRCFGLRTAILTALVDSDIGHLVEDLMLQGGVNTEFIKWLPFDGIGRTSRIGLNFTERGFGIRGAVGVSDRANSAAAHMNVESIDWDQFFGTVGTRWLHTGGIFAALSDTSWQAAEAAMTAARAHGTIVSFDLNYRPSLWQDRGGREGAWRVYRRLIELVDVLIGIPGMDEDLSDPSESVLQSMIHRVADDYPNVSVIATTLRGVRSATVNDWRAVAWSREEGLVGSSEYSELEILDRVGGGDSFASGLIYGLLQGFDLATSVEYGAAHGALAMTTPGDSSMASLEEVKHVLKGGGSRVIR